MKIEEHQTQPFKFYQKCTKCGQSIRKDHSYNHQLECQPILVKQEQVIDEVSTHLKKLQAKMYIKISVKDLRPWMIGREVTLKGIIIKITEIYPQMKSACFKCQNCQHTTLVHVHKDQVEHPSICKMCNQTNSYALEHNLSKFTDKQYIKIQDIPQLLDSGQTPSSIIVKVQGEIIDNLRKGDKVTLSGIYRIVGKFRNISKTQCATFIELLSIKTVTQGGGRPNNIAFSQEQKILFAKMAKKKTIVDDLAHSFAPSVFQNKQIKKGLLCQLFAGLDSQYCRNSIHISLIGDPSTAKSILLKEVTKIAPRSILINGRLSSAVGLTAKVAKDPQTHEFFLESGALVLSDQGICCIDEFDKMDQKSRNVLLEAMEQQTISIAKAGIVCQLNTRTAILAAANPINSKYDFRKSLAQNINLSPSLLSRFDLIFLKLDIQNQSSDKLIAAHILTFYTNKPAKSAKQHEYSSDLLAKYIRYARDLPNPTITKKAGEKISRQYLRMRAMNFTNIPAVTLNQLQSLIRLSKSFARMRLSQKVNIEDVQQAVSLMLSGTITAATDMQTGFADIGIINYGISSSLLKKIKKYRRYVMMMLCANAKEYQKPTFLSKFITDFNKLITGLPITITNEQFLHVFKMLQTEEKIHLFSNSSKANHKFVFIKPL